MFFELDKGVNTKLQAEQYLAYWAEEREANSELWRSKLKPVNFKKGNANRARKFVTRSVRTVLVEDQGEEEEDDEGGGGGGEGGGGGVAGGRSGGCGGNFSEESEGEDE